MPKLDDPWSVPDLERRVVAPAFLDALSAAPHVSPGGGGGARIDVGPDATRSAKVVSMRDLLPRLRRYAFAFRSCPSPRRARTVAFGNDLLDTVTARVLPHLAEVRGQALSLDDVVYQGLLVVRGAPFPFLHWDQDWGAFPNAAGFQIWCMVDGFHGEAPNFGTMFLAAAKDLGAAEPPSRWDVLEDGTVRKAVYYGSIDTMPVKSYGSLAEAGLAFAYLNATPGDAAVFSKRTLHVSDPRPHLARRPDPHGRVALVWRVIVREPSGALPLWSGHLHARKYAPEIARNFSRRSEADFFFPARHGLVDRCLGKHPLFGTLAGSPP